MKNAKTIFTLRVIKHIINLFTSSFLVMYFYKLTNSNILPIAMYYILVYLFIFLFTNFFKNINKGKKRILVLRAGMIFNFIYFLLIGILKENLVNYIWLIGIIYGISEGLYYSAYNIIESNKVKNKERNTFTGYYHITSRVTSIVLPILLGTSLDLIPYSKVAIYILVLCLLQIFITFFIKVEVIDYKKTNIKEFRKLLKRKDKQHIKNNYIISMFSRSTTDTLSTLVTLYIIMVFKTNFNLGVIESVAAIATIVMSFIFATKGSRKNYKKMIKINFFVALISLIYLLIDCNKISIVLFQLVFASSINIIINMLSTNTYDFTNQESIKKYKVEFFVVYEFYLMIGRIGSYLLLLIAGLFNSLLSLKILLFIFIISFVIFTYMLYKNQDKIPKTLD